MEGTVKFPATFRRYLVVAVLCAVNCAGSRGNSGIDEYEVLELYEVWQHQQIHLLGDIMQARADHGRWEMGDQPGEKINFAKC